MIHATRICRRTALALQVSLVLGLVVLVGGCELSGPQDPDAGPSGDPNGSSCMSSSACASGHCVDGVCCDDACTSRCHACTAALKGNGADGTCEMIKPGTEPVMECIEGTCNAYGVCALEPPANFCIFPTDCASGFCVNNLCCDQSACTPMDSCFLSTCAPGTCTDIPRACPHGGTCSNGACPGQCTGIFGFSGPPVFKGIQSKYDGHVSHVVMGDLDGDGLQDIVRSTNGVEFLSTYIGTIGVFRNNGDGTFTTFGLSGNYADVLGLADMNNDGALDIVQSAYQASSAQNLLVYLNDGQGGFPTPYYNQLSYSISEMNKQVIVDLNNDNYRDVMVRETDSGRLFAKLNKKGGQAGKTFDPIFDTAITGYDDFDATDLNADGKADLVLAKSSTGMVEVRFGNGNGTFGSPANYVAVAGVNAVAFRDLDADGNIDLVASNGTNTDVRLNMGSGSFAARTTYAGGSTDIADINGDGRPDILGSTTLFNNGNGTFAEQAMDFMPHENAAFGDLNSDGLVDIARKNYNSVSLYYNQGNGAFVRPYVQYNLSFADPHHFVSADLNGDNIEDWVMITPTNTIAVWINMGSGNFAPQVDYTTKLSTNELAAADMNGDKTLDLVASGETNVEVLLNLGGGIFGPAVTYAAGSMQKQCSATGDFNGDGYADVARLAPSPDHANLKVMFNQGNGTLGPSVDIATLDANPKELVTSDLNGDGRADLLVRDQQDDIEVFLSDGMGGFALQVLQPGLGMIDSFVVADYNGDVYPDIGAVHVSDISPQMTTASIYWNNGDGTFRYGPSKTWNYGASDISVAADVDGNGFKDVILEGIRVFLNDGVSLGPEIEYETIGSYRVATDVDGDGISELLSSEGALHRVACPP
jgi:hypothetical protein